MWNWIGKLETLRQTGTPFVIATVTQVTGSVPRETGAKMLVLAAPNFFGTIGGGHLEQLVLEDARKVMNSGISKVIRYPLGAKTGQCCGGIVEVLFEPVQCGPRLLLFGAGHVGQAVCRTLMGTPFTVHAIDNRKEWIHAPELPSDVIRHETEWDEFVDTARWDCERTYVVVMTHRHDLDQEIIHHAIGREAKYIGLIGSKSKWLRFRQRLSLRGVSETALNRVKSPIGIPVGGKSPQEVAISLAAELLQIHYAP